jgi:Tol biopolymer transport system component
MTCTQTRATVREGVGPARLLGAASTRGRKEETGMRGRSSRPWSRLLVAVSVVSSLAVVAGSAGDTRAAFSGVNGRVVVQVTAPGGTGEAHLWIFHPDKGAGVELTRTAGSHDANPAWSPDGEQIAYNSNALGGAEGNHDLWVVDQDGADRRRITSGSGADVDPSWSPDGTRIAFASDRGGNHDIWSVDAAGESVPIRLTASPAADEQPAWSPDGTRIAFVSSRDGNRELYVMDANGSNQRRLTVSAATDRHPAWSGDGQRLAFDSDRSGNFEVYTMGTDGSDIRDVTQNPALDARPAWSADGRYILFQSERRGRGRRDIYRIETLGGTVERDVWGYLAWATSPDWQRLPTFDDDSCAIRGTIFDDEIDIYSTSRGPERICGLDGDDYIDGGRGNDVIRGGPGNDRLIANDQDADRLFGDTGNDSFWVVDDPQRRDVVDGGGGRDSVAGDFRDRFVRVERIQRCCKR